MESSNQFAHLRTKTIPYSPPSFSCPTHSFTDPNSFSLLITPLLSPVLSFLQSSGQIFPVMATHSSIFRETWRWERSWRFSRSFLLFADIITLPCNRFLALSYLTILPSVASQITAIPYFCWASFSLFKFPGPNWSFLPLHFSPSSSTLQMSITKMESSSTTVPQFKAPYFWRQSDVPHILKGYLRKNFPFEIFNSLLFDSCLVCL